MAEQKRRPLRRRPSPARERDRLQIQRHKTEAPFLGTRLRAADGTEYKIKILARGEQAFYQEAERALVLEISAAHGLILKDTIRWWDDGSAVSGDERDRIIRRVGEYLTQRGSPDVYTVK